MSSPSQCRALQLGCGSILCFAEWSSAGGGSGAWGGRGAFYVLRQLLYSSDKCVFLLAKVSYLLLTTCKAVVVSRAGQPRAVVEDTTELISAQCCVSPCSALTRRRGLLSALESSVPWLELGLLGAEAKADFRQVPCARAGGGNLLQASVAKESGFTPYSPSLCRGTCAVAIHNLLGTSEAPVGSLWG